MPPKSKKSTKSSSSGPGVLKASENIVNSGAAKLKTGVNALGRGLGRLTEYLEGPFTLLVIVLVIVLGIYAVIKLWKYESCKVSQHMNATATHDVLEAHATKFKETIDDESTYSKDADAKCAASMQYLRAMSGSYGQTVADNAIKSVTATEGESSSENLPQYTADAIKNVRYFCDKSRISDGKLNACDALEAWGSENKVHAIMTDDSGSVKASYGARVIAMGENDSSLKDQFTGQSLTKDATYNDTQAATIADQLFNAATEYKQLVQDEVQAYKHPIPPKS